MTNDYYLFLHLRNWAASQQFEETEDLKTSVQNPSQGAAFLCGRFEKTIMILEAFGTKS